MARGLTPYLSEFANAWETPSRFGDTAMPSPYRAAPTATSTAASARPSTAATPDTLAPGSTAERPALVPVVRLHVLTVAGWQAEMRSAAADLGRLQTEVRTREARGVVRLAQPREPRNPPVQLAPNYETREFPVPSDGTCNMAELVWGDIWLAAQALLRKLAARPPVGTPGADIFRWVQNIHTARRILFMSANLREMPLEQRRAQVPSGFFGLGSSSPTNRTLGVVYDQGLASDGQSRGVYTAQTRPAGSTMLTAMDYAPIPAGGYAEMLGSNLRQRAVLWGAVSDGQNRGGAIIAAPGTLRNLPVFAGDPTLGKPAAGVPYSTTSFFPEGYSDTFGSQAWVEREVAWLWSKTPAESPFRTTRVVRTLTRGGRPWTRVFDFGTDIEAWISNAYEYASYFGQPAFSFAAVTLRTTGFYLNSYLDYAAQQGLIPREDVTAARAEGDRILNDARNTIRTAVYTATGVISAIVSTIPVVGAVIAGLLSIATALLVELGGAASGGVSVSPVLPLYDRTFSGTCRETAWISRPSRSDATTDDTAPPPVLTPDGGSVDTEGAKGAGGIIFGVGALWLAYQLFKR